METKGAHVHLQATASFQLCGDKRPLMTLKAVEDGVEVLGQRVGAELAGAWGNDRVEVMMLVGVCRG